MDEEHGLVEQERENSEWWARATFLLVGIVMTLLGAWATHSASRDDIQEAIKAHNEATAGHMVALQQRLEDIDSRQKKMNETLLQLQLDQAAMNKAKR